MDERGQFTFYRSFWEAVKGLPKKDRLPILEAIISYALDGEIPKGLSQSQAAFFLLVKPNLDSSRKKAASGKQGGSKTKAKGKQSEREKENEDKKENEIEIEGEGEKEKKHPPNDGKLFSLFWEEYPDKACRDAAWEAWEELNPDPGAAEQIMASLSAWKRSEQWTEKNGKFIPRAAKWLKEGHWRNNPKPSEQVWQLTGERPFDQYELEAIQRVLKDPGLRDVEEME